METELESEEPTKMGGATSASEDKGDRGAVVSSVEYREPTAVSVDGGLDTETYDDVPKFRKCPRAKTPPSNEGRSGRDRHGLRRRYWLCTPLL